MYLTFQQAIVLLPLLTAIITFLLTSIFTLYRDNKINNLSNRIFLDYIQFELKYPFKNDPKFGKGKILLSENGSMLNYYAEQHGESYINFLILSNTTQNNAINIRIKYVISDRISNNKITDSNKILTEEFFLPIWKWEDTLYIPATFYDKSSNFTTDEELSITYNTTTFEKFEYSFKRQKDGSYKEKLKKRYLGFLWVSKINYMKSNFYKVVNVREKDAEN